MIWPLAHFAVRMKGQESAATSHESEPDERSRQCKPLTARVNDVSQTLEA